MAKNLREDVFIGTDNSFTLNISIIDGDPVDLSSVTSMKLWLGDTCSHEIDSITYPDAFDWSATLPLTEGDVRFTLGQAILALTIQEGSYNTRLKLFSATSPNGIVVFDNSSRDYRLKIRVLASCET